MKNALFSAVLLAALALLMVCGSQAAQADDMAPAERIKANCTSCHGLDKVCGKIGTFGPLEWSGTVRTMIEKGSELNSAYMLDVSSFLSRSEESRPALCQ